MTFYELEKLCKKKRLKKILTYSGIAAGVISAAVFWLLANNTHTRHTLAKKPQPTPKPTPKQKTPPPVKPSDNTSKKPLKPAPVKKEIKPKKEAVLMPVITLNNNAPAPEPYVNKPAPKESKNSIFSSTPLPSYQTCINLAKKYYQKGDYQNAILWAKNANIQDKKAKESWIITAKALYKEGKKEKALKVLKIYYKFSKDKEVKDVIEEINSSK
ncbi:MAG: hypothetical protein GXO62_04770 [Epsilonproteobacteria bacterium]|nr:hypothetical protein [Campylobacterota bacterium]